MNKNYFIAILFSVIGCAGKQKVADSFVFSKTQIEFDRIRMTKLALDQANHFSPRWDPSQRDCAGFIRYLFRESVVSHPRTWLSSQSKQQTYVSADELMAYNFDKIETDSENFESSLETGDVLVFERPNQKPEDAWHLMVILKSPYVYQQKLLVVYHNGDRSEKGEVRKVWLADLEQSPFHEWRPNKNNQYFHGVYRWKEWL